MGLVYALDVSNWQGDQLAAMIARHRPDHVVVRLSTESPAMITLARDQLKVASDLGVSVSGYLWADWTAEPELHTILALHTGAGFDLRRVWIDCEQGEPGQAVLEDWLSRAVAVAEAAGAHCGVYTTVDWWQRQGNSQGFTRLPLWLAFWDLTATLALEGRWASPLPGGWATLSGKQWDGGDAGVALDHVGRDVFNSAVLEHLDPESSCAALRVALRAELAKPRLNRKRLERLVAEPANPRR